MNEGKPVFYLDLKQTFYRLFVANSSSIFSFSAITVVVFAVQYCWAAELMMEKKRSTTLDDEKKMEVRNCNNIFAWMSNFALIVCWIEKIVA